MIEVKNVDLKIGRKQILKDVSLTMKPGQILGLIGPNGAGKTTIMKAILTWRFIDAGEILIDGETLSTAALKDFGAVIETPEFYDYLTGRENLELLAELSKPVVDDERIDEVIALVKAEDFIDDKVKTYSLGMKQRLALAQAILNKPKYLLLDEPLNGLDPRGMKDFKDLVLEIAHNEGTSVLISSHLLSDLEQMFDELVVVQKGVVTKTATRAEVDADEKSLEDQFLEWTEN
ncbi:MAG: ATP-binding cassette domain-containing protein [Lactobacillales bacterium]|jgi:ABC-2 type transport system ATP-binding protein|nr:ATP-binding cassette domain-containing protein [Lactobacillales bacterium]